MNRMFSGAADFNQPLSEWNVSAVTNMNGMFYNAADFNQPLSSWNVSQVDDMTTMFTRANSFQQNLGKWYIVPADTAYDNSERTLNVTTISTQNSVLDGHSPNYGIGSGDDSALFNMTGSTLMFKDTPSVGSHAANVTASGGSVFEDGNNWRELAITVTGADNNPPNVDAGEDQTVGEGDTVTLSGSAADPDSGDSVESYSWSAPTDSGITFANSSSASTTFTAPDVDGDATFTLTLTAGDGTDTGSGDVDVTVKETGSAFITTWKTTSNNEEITIPGTGTYSVVWGDGAATDETDTAEHEYADAGTYTVSITGGLKRIYLNADTAIAPKLQSIEQWGDAEWTSMEAAFDGAHNMEYNASDAPDLSGVDSTAYMFYSTSFNGDLSGWNVSQVTNMNSMFNGNARFNGDLSGWDVSQVTSMISMFWNAAAFNGDLSGWDVSQVTSMTSMFRSTSFDGNLSGWNVSQVTSMTSMFYNTVDFNQPLNDWNVSQVTTMDRMFAGAISFDGNLSGWNVSQVTNMDRMFASATSFDGNLSGWNVSQVTSMNDMFFSATDFDQNLGNWYVVPADTAYDTSEATLNVTTISAQNVFLEATPPSTGSEPAATRYPST